MSSPLVSIILCTVNEGENLPRLLEEIENSMNYTFHIIFVDDGSTDGKRDFIESYCSIHPGSKKIYNEHKMSLLIANHMGMRESSSKYTVIMDSDLQHPVDAINDIVKKLDEGCDICVASRYSPGGSPGNRKPIRGLISRVAEYMARIMIRGANKTSDPLSGYFGFRTGLNFFIDERWRGYKTLLFLLASNPRARVCDVPYRFREREKGESKIVSGIGFLLRYTTEIILIKRTEMKAESLQNV